MNRIIESISMVILAGFIVSSTVINIDPRYSAVLSGGITSISTLVCPGIHFRLPSPLRRTTLVDMRLQSIDMTNPLQVITSDNNKLLVTYTIIYRVSDAIKYVGEINRKSLYFIVNKLSREMKLFLSDEFARHTLNDVLSDQRTLANDVRDSLRKIATGFGLDLIEVRLMRVDMPITQIDDVYQRMNDKIHKQVTQIRIGSDIEVQKIIACADYNRHKVIANYYERAQRIRGEGDAKAASIIADAFSRDPKFYQLYSSLQAYKNIFKDNDIIVVSPDSEFFKFMHSSVGKIIRK
ncbi:MAG: SPFH domain-containing protein [Burkholderia sp.]|nr:SPFH domain-containing protein [Burkholderia sp.]